MRVVHYINQFFAGIGGEEQAGHPLEVRTGPVGPGRLLQQHLGQAAAVMATLICGDNRFHDGGEAPHVLAALRDLRPDAVVAGPAFAAGRYGLACLEVCRLAAQELGVRAVTGMAPDNPAVSVGAKAVYIVPTGQSAAGMGEALPRMAALVLKAEPGPAEADGYLPRGIRRPGLREKPGHVRAVDMLVARVNGQPFRSEIPITAYETVPPAPPLSVSPAEAKLAFITSGGLVVRGNPGRMVRGGATHWLRYPLEKLEAGAGQGFEAIHGGYSTHHVNDNPFYLVPVDVFRPLVREVYPEYFVTTGNATTVAHARRMGAEMAQELKAAQVQAAVLVAT